MTTTDTQLIRFIQDVRLRSTEYRAGDELTLPAADVGQLITAGLAVPVSAKPKTKE